VTPDPTSLEVRVSSDPTTGNSFALGRRGFLGAAAALGGTAALAPMASAAPLDRPADKPDPAKAGPDQPASPERRLAREGHRRQRHRRDRQARRIIKDVIKRTGVPGLAAAVVHNGQVKFLEGYGVADKTLGNKVTPDTVFQLASVSKSLAGSAVARAIGRAVDPKPVDWTDPIVKHIPGFALADPYVTANVTIQDMLSHRSGLPGAAGDLLEDLGYDQSHVLTQLRLDPLNPIRTIYNYANFGFTAGAIAASNAMRQPWAEFADASSSVRSG
jgi:CubicO group peptidase (beta-lactamase class C family)